MPDSAGNPAVRLRALARRAVLKLTTSEELRLLVLAVIIGIVTSAAAVAFHELIDLTRRTLYERLDPHVDLYGRGIWMLALIPALGGLVVGCMTHYVMRIREGHGIIDVMESVIRSRGYIRPISAIEKILTSAVTIGSGGSAGAEGPIVQIGAAIASGVGQVTRTSVPLMPLLVGCGSAAGISAIFNSPFGGVLFTLEVILLDFSLRTFTPIVLASVVANVTTQAIFHRLHGAAGYDAIFAMPGWQLMQQHALDWRQVANFVLLGVICGIVGATFTQAMYFSEGRFAKINIPKALRPALGGFILGLLGVAYIVIFGWMMLGQSKPFAFEQYAMPAFFGDGYGVVRQLLDGSVYQHLTLGHLVLLLSFLCLAKIFGTCVTLSSGGSGGIMAPSLFLGATAGSVVGLVLRAMGWHVQPEVYALVGMGAALAAVVHAPLASILIVFELTRDDKVILPAMLACILATATARLFFRDSIYTLALRHRGVRIGTMADLTLLRRLSVEQAQLEPAVFIKESDSVQHVLELIPRTASAAFVVVDDRGHYKGILTLDDVKDALLDPTAVPLLVVRDVARGDIPILATTDDLAAALDTFGRNNTDHLAVSGNRNAQTVTSIVSRASLMRLYQQELENRS